MTSLDLVRQQTLEVLREIESPFVKWALFKAYSVRFGSQLPYSDCGFLTLCDFLESIPGVRIASSPNLYSFEEEPETRRQSSTAEEEDEQKEATVSRETSLSCSLATIEEDPGVFDASPPATCEEPPVVIPPPMTMDLFRKQALAVAKKCQKVLSLRELTIAYCQEYNVLMVPFRALGFHSFAACLMAIPELFTRVRLELERELLECVKPLKKPFPPSYPAKRYCLFKDKTWVPFRTAGYCSLWDILICLPGVVDNGDGRLRYEGDRKPNFDVIPESTRFPAKLTTENVFECVAKEPHGSPSTGIGSDKEDQLMTKKGQKQAPESPQPAAEETASTTSSTPPGTGSRDDSGTATDQSLLVSSPTSLPTSSCQPAVIPMPSPVSRNECVGRFITSLLDEAEKRGVNVAEMTKKIINAALDYKE